MSDAGRGRAVENAFREANGQAVATLVRAFGDIDIAQDAVQDAFAVATERWEREGVPPEPVGWIVTTARRKAIDRLRRESRGSELQRESALLESRARGIPGHIEPVKDDLLRLMFTCCHPALQTEHQIALTLRLLGGLEVDEIARAFLVSETAMAKRLVRAKYKIKEAGIPYRVPQEDELADRLRAVLRVVYLIYSAGLDEESRSPLRREAIRLGYALVDLLPDEPEAVGLLSLMLSSEARATARSPAEGVVLLRDQDRRRWNPQMIAEATALLNTRTGDGVPGPYQIEAAIQATHNAADSIGDTDWARIVDLYDVLFALTPTPIIALNRAIAVAEANGAHAGLGSLDDIGTALDDYHLIHAARGTMLREIGQSGAARDAFVRAAELAPTAEIRHRLLSEPIS